MAFKNKEDRRRYMREYYAKRIESLKARLGGVCVSCGSTEDLEFDHIDPESKSFSISELMKYSKEVVDSEIEKCQLLCSHCHKIKSCSDRGQTLTVDKNGDRVVHGTPSGARHCGCNECKIFKKKYTAPLQKKWYEEKKKTHVRKTIDGKRIWVPK